MQKQELNILLGGMDLGDGIQTMCVRVDRHSKPIINPDFKSGKSNDDDDPN